METSRNGFYLLADGQLVVFMYEGTENCIRVQLHLVCYTGIDIGQVNTYPLVYHHI